MPSDDLFTPVAPVGAPRPVRREDERRPGRPVRDERSPAPRRPRRDDDTPHHIDEYA